MKTNSEKKRSIGQNKDYWGFVVDSITTQFIAEPQKLIRFIQHVVGESLFTPEMTHELLKAKFNKGNSTTKLSVSEYSDFRQSIASYMKFHFDIDVLEPNEKEENSYD